MDTVTRGSDNGTDRPLPPPELTPYFRRCERFDREAGRLAVALGLPPDPWAA